MTTPDDSQPSEAQKLLTEIEGFLIVSGMGETSFGMRAIKNPHLLARLRSGGTVSIDTAGSIRSFIAAQTKDAKAPSSPG